jgi:RNA polymerase sigma-70 factor, ECF subfamily
VDQFWSGASTRALAGDADDADDLVQETWMAAWRKPPSAERPLRSWIGTVIRRQWSKRASSEKQRHAREQLFASTQGDAPSSDELLERMEAQKRLASLVTGLHEPYRQTVLLRYYEGLSCAQIALRLQIPAGTVRWRLKTALNQLKRALEKEGAGQHWLKALIPLHPVLGDAQTCTQTRWWAASVAVLVMVPVGVWVAAVGSPPSQHSSKAPMAASPTSPAYAVTSTEAGSPPPAGTIGPRYAAGASGLAACRDEAENQRQRVRTLEANLFRGRYAEERFARGEPNPKAQAALGPIVARIMKSGGGSAPAYVFECRTWVCKLAVTLTKEEATAEQLRRWIVPFQDSAEMRWRQRGGATRNLGFMRDAVTGTIIERKDLYVILKDPSGEPVEGEGPRPELSGDIESCRRVVSSLRTRLALAQAEANGSASPVEVFATATANVGLTEELRAEITRIFSGQSQAPSVECRAMVCKVTWSAGIAAAPRRNFEAELDSRKREASLSPDGTVFAVMKTSEERAAMRWLTNLRDVFVSSSAPATCERMHPEEGTLTVDLQVPATGEPNADGIVDRVSAAYGDVLMGTPFARCIADELARGALATEPPIPTAAAKVRMRLQLPLSAAR